MIEILDVINHKNLDTICFFWSHCSRYNTNNALCNSVRMFEDHCDIMNYCYSDGNGLNSENMDGKKRLTYRSTELIGNKDFSPREMLEIHIKLENMLRDEYFIEVQVLEMDMKLPKTWLNYVIHWLIVENGNGLKEKLIYNFCDRGFSNEMFQ